MAFWNRRNNGYIYVYTLRDGKQKALPRKDTRHLDVEPDHNVEAWVRQYEHQYEKAKFQRENLFSDNSELSRQITAYIEYLRSRGKSPNTIKWHDTALRRDVVPFFLDGDTPIQNPQFWASKSIRLHSWLLAREIPKGTYSIITRANIALRGFYAYLSDEGVIQNGLVIRLRNPISQSNSVVTPLKYALKPEEVLEYALSVDNFSLKIIALTGYFFSLRPYEIFALKREDFRAGEKAREYECSKIIHNLNGLDGKDLYGNFIVNISKQRNKEKECPPKSFSKGFVACFDERAARLLVPAINDFPVNELLVPQKIDFLFKLWKIKGIPGITIKDLRRASLYHLGHHTTFDLPNLQKHARHKYSVTTEKYLRRPGEDAGEFLTLDLDA